VDFLTRKEILTLVYYMAEAADSVYFYHLDPLQFVDSYSDVLKTYYEQDPLMLQVALSFFSLVVQLRPKSDQEAIYL